MSFGNKGPASTSPFEVDPRDVLFQRKQGRIRLFNSIRLGLTALSLLAGITILGTTSHALAVYNNTHVPADYNLPLWPAEFDVRPTVALVAGSAVVVVANMVSFVFSKVKVLQNKAVAHTSVTFLAPFAGFVAALVAITFFYAINASATVDTLQSWSCTWGPATSSSAFTHFGALCRQSRAALYLAVALVPLELATFTAAGVQMALERKTTFAPAVKMSSPALS